jgi:peptidylprolyl isomerase
MVATIISAYDVPLEKVERPQMKPRARLPDITHRVYFEISIDGQSPKSGQRIVFGLFGDALPKTVENFVQLATCDKGIMSKVVTDKPLCYKGSPFHRIVPSFGISGGDAVFHDGTGSESIYDTTFFDDESFEVMHNKKGLINMANHGKNTNGSQFFIQTNKVT